MAITVAALNASLTADVSQFQAGLNSATAALGKLSQAAQSHAGQTESAMGGISAKAVALGGIMANVATSAVGALGNLAGSAVGAVASFEQMTAKLTALTAKELVDAGQFKNFDDALGAATEKSKTLLDWTQKLAVASPFGESDVSAVLGVASAFGFLTQKYQTVKEAQDAGVISAQRLTNAILNFGAATGVSGANLDSIARVAGQIKSMGKLMGGDSMQLKNFGINLEEAIGQSIGKTTQQVIEMREKGLVTADMALQALVGSMEKFGKAAELQGGSLGGLLASLSDLQKVATRNIFGPMFESLKPALAGAVTALQSPEVGQAMQNFGNSVGAGVTTALGALQTLASQAQSLMSAFAAGMATGGVGGGTSSLLTALGLDPSLAATAGAVLNSVVSAVQTGMSQLQAVLGTAGAAWQAFTAAAAGVVAQLGPPLGQIASIVGGVLGAAFQTLGAVAGVVFAGLPALIQAVAGPAQTIAGVVGSYLVSAFASLGTIAQAVFAGLPGLAQTVMAVLTAFASYVSSTLAGAFQIIYPIAASVFAGIATVVQMALPGVFAVANAVGSLLVAAFNALQGIATAVFAAIMPYIPALQNYIAALSVVIGSVLGAAFNWLAGVIQGTVIPAVQAAGKWLAENLAGAMGAVMGFIVGTLLPGLLNLATWLMQNLPGAIQVLSNFWTGVLQPAIATVWGFITGTLFPLFGQLVAWLQESIPAGLAALSGFWQQHGDQILSIAQTAWDTIKGVIEAVLGTITGLWQAFQSAREGDWTGFGQKLRDIWDASWEAIKSALAAAGPTILAILSDLVNNAVAVFQSINWGEVGSNIVQGIANGIKAGASWIADAARDAAKAALDAAKGFLGIHSPSRVMADEVGLPMAQGLAAGFADGLNGSALVGVVSGIRSLMEQVGRVLKGVGDTVSMSDWEDLAGPVGQMANMFKAVAEIGKALSQEGLAASWDTARAQAAGMIASIRVILTQIAPLLKGVGDVVSTSDWEDFTAPLKMLADSLSSIASISGLFGDDKAQPSLAGLGGRIRQLAVDARALLVDLDSAIAPVSALLPAKLKDLGDAAAGAKSIAENALGLVKALQEALSVDWAGINWPDAGRMMHDLAGMVLYFASKAEEASVAIARVDTSGLAPLKANAESLMGIADGARGLVTRLVDALTVKWGAIDWPAAGRMMHDLTVMAAYFVTKASEATAGLKSVDMSGLGPLAQAAQSTLDIATRTMDLVRAAVGALAFDWSGVSVNGVVSFVGWLVGLGVQLASAATTALGTWSATVKPALADLGTVLGDSLAVLDNTFKLVAAVGVGSMAGMTGRDFLGQGPGGYSPIQNRLIWLVMVGQQLATAANEAMGTWTTTVKASLTNLGTVLKDSLSVLSDTFKIVETVAVGNMEGMTGRDFAPQGPGGYSPIQNRVLWVVLVGQKLAEAARDAMGTWSIDVPAALTPLKAVLSDGLSIIKDTLETVATLTGKDFPDLSDAVVATVTSRLTRLLVVGQTLATEANRVMTGWTLEVAPGFAALKGVLSDSLSIAKDALDLTGLLTGKDFPDLGDAVLGLLKTRLARLIYAGQELAAQANATMTGWSLTVAPGFGALKSVLSDSLGIAKDALDTVILLGAEKFPDLGDGVLSVVKTRLARLIVMGRDLAAAANTALGTWTLEVAPGWAALKGVLSDSLGAAKDTLDAVGLLGGDKFPDVGGSLGVVRERLGQLVRAGRDLAQAANTALGTWTMTVAPGWAALKSVLGDSLGVVKDTLEFATLQTDLLAFRGLDMTRLGPKIDLLIQGAVAVARAFGEKAAQANLKEEWTRAGEALAKLFGDAAGTLGDALDLGTRLLDPATQIPSLGQIDGKLTAILSLVETVTQRFAEKAAAVGPDTAKSAGGLADAVKSVFDAISQVIKAVQDAAGLYLGTSGFNNIAALLTYLFDTFDQFAGRAEGVNAVTAAITSLLGGLQALVAQAGTAAGTSWAQQFAAAITANAGLIQSAIQGALAPGNAGTGGGAVVSPGDERRFTPGNTATGTTVNQTVHVTLSTAAGLPATLEYLVNMAKA